MKRLSLIPVLLFLMFSIRCGQKSSVEVKNVNVDSLNKPVEKRDSTRKDIQAAITFRRVQQRAEVNFIATSNSQTYYCSAKGMIEKSDTTGENRKLLFDLEVNYIIDKFYLLPLQNDEYIACWQETSYLGLNSYVLKFAAGKESADWMVSYKAPDPGVPVLADDHVYLSTLGMISKVNVGTGQQAWIHDSLYQTASLKYKRFDVPKLYPNTVVFFDFPIEGRKGKRDSIWVMDKTGEFIR
jgi:hypothetical protein